MAQTSSNDKKNWGTKISLDCPFNEIKHDLHIFCLFAASFLCYFAEAVSLYPSRVLPEEEGGEIFILVSTVFTIAQVWKLIS